MPDWNRLAATQSFKFFTKSFNLSNTDNRINIKLKEVFYVPLLNECSISLYVFIEINYICSRHKGKCTTIQ